MAQLQQWERRSAEDERRRTDLENQRDRLAVVQVPDGLAALEQAQETATRAVRDAAAAEAGAEQADAAVRERLADAPPRAPAEKAVRDHEERARVRAVLPAAQAELEVSTAALGTASADRAAAEVTAVTARVHNDAATRESVSATAALAGLEAEISSLQAVSAPDDSDAIGEQVRAAAAAAAVAAAAQQVSQAEQAEQEVRAAHADAPPRQPLDTALRLLGDLDGAATDLSVTLATERDVVAVATTTGERLRAAVTVRDTARHARENAALANNAAALRPLLTLDEPCPVCEQVVTRLPGAAPSAQLDAADANLSAAEEQLRVARTAAGAAQAAAARAATQREIAESRLAGIRTALDGLPGDPAAVRAQLAELDALADRHAAATARSERARRMHRAADAEVATARTDSDVLETELHRARDPLVRLGAPALAEIDVASAWQQLISWAAARSRPAARHGSWRPMLPRPPPTPPGVRSPACRRPTRASPAAVPPRTRRSAGTNGPMPS